MSWKTDHCLITMLWSLKSLFCVMDIYVFSGIVLHLHAEAYSEPCQTFKMTLFAKTGDDLMLLTIFTKNSILGVWQSSILIS